MSASPSRPGTLDDPFIVSDEPAAQTSGSREQSEKQDSTSPISATISESGGSFYRMNEPPRPTLHHYPINLNAARKINIRSDPALVTSFDPTDKELYDLWVPKQ
ncbi:hypothetical protein BJ138DRAFT_447815 [Hygrophoropsis aurantiaca]|uniref:Uncharacterized protein n=1 Tax=Hygrophoropsis aurantiaca TaxID=72124 RepID=A0ACB8AMN5_9AGAM|nr:hypothetical protein BJ138DRAFT_447815 [Hygrophoropsis aurantiaca]